jgi:predicted ABC-type sugar transport system permease subunit
MTAKAGLIGTVFGTVAGAIAWLADLDQVLWPRHHRWALFVIVISIAIVAAMIADRDLRRMDGGL